MFTSIPGEMIQFEKHIFQTGWNHQLDILIYMFTILDDIVIVYDTATLER